MSFIDTSLNTDFPIQNLPYGVFSTTDNPKHRIGVAIGEEILDLSVVKHLFTGPILSKNKDVFDKSQLNDFMALPKEAWHEARFTLQRLLSSSESIIRDDQTIRNRAFVNQSKARMHLPTCIGGFVDFSSSLYHALNCVKLGMLRKGEEANEADQLPANWLWCPIGYHGRASSVVVSDTPITRPYGQVRPKPAEPPVFQASQCVDFELEMGFLVGGPPNQLGYPIPIDQAHDHIFGMVLLNDWSARDIQKWEQDERGPFVSKNFGTTVSPWVVTMQALEPFMVENPSQDPLPFPYLRHSDPYSFSIHLELSIKGNDTPEPFTVVKSNFKHMYWTMKQQLSHYTLSGCDVHAGDLMGSGTVSGPDPISYGCLLEQTLGGTKPVQLGDTSRTFLLDHDQISITGWCAPPNGEYKIGFGQCNGKITPALKSEK